MFRDKNGAFFAQDRLQRRLRCFSPGNESIAVVELAPFQKVPNEKKKADSRAGTIEKGPYVELMRLLPPHLPNTDEDYVSFLESLKEVSTKPFDADTLETLSASMLS